MTRPCIEFKPSKAVQDYFEWAWNTQATMLDVSKSSRLDLDRLIDDLGLVHSVEELGKPEDIYAPMRPHVTAECDALMEDEFKDFHDTKEKEMAWRAEFWNMEIKHRYHEYHKARTINGMLRQAGIDDNFEAVNEVLPFCDPKKMDREKLDEVLSKYMSHEMRDHITVYFDRQALDEATPQVKASSECISQDIVRGRRL